MINVPGQSMTMAHDTRSLSGHASAYASLDAVMSAPAGRVALPKQRQE